MLKWPLELEYVFGPAASFANLTENGYVVGEDIYDSELRGSYSNRPATISTAEYHALWAY